MSESDSATHMKGSVGEKFKTCTISENMKQGALGDSPVSVGDAGDTASSDSSTNKATEAFGSKGSEQHMEAKTISPGGKPDSSFINTSAVK